MGRLRFNRREGSLVALDRRYNLSYTRPMKTAISIPDEIFEAAELTAKRLGMSRSELFSKAVARFVESLNATRVTERLDAVYEGEDARVDPVLEALQRGSVADEGW